MGFRGGALRLAGAAAVVMVGAGACALEAGQRPEGGEALRPAVTPRETGASASPGPGSGALTGGDAGEPGSDQVGRPGPAVEPDPAPTATGKPPAEPAKRRPGCPRGEHQRQVERYLSRLGGYGTVTVDGAQSAADCKAIKKFQRRFGISPAAGRAGPTTLAVARRLANTDTADCDAGKKLTICIDLTHQTVWAVRGGEVVLGPTVTRTGMSGFATPAGTFRVGWRNPREWSNPYKVWLPYWQQFHGGMGFHETTTYIHDGGIGSHGCVNLLPRDARQLWDLAKVGTRVHAFGRRAGT
jgi:lipoprotein-anchoring transpeptidase ErfK/SrfK